MLKYLVLIGAAVQLLGIFSYIKGVIKGSIKPNRVTWLLWATAPIIASAAAVSDGVGWAALPVFMSGFGPLLVFIASLLNKHAYWQLQRFDYVCGALSVLALVLWAITKEPAVAILFAIASDGLAAVPTLVKSWKYPETEGVGPFTAGLFSTITTFAAIKLWGFSELAFPIYLLIINISFILIILRGEIFKKRPALQ